MIRLLHLLNVQADRQTRRCQEQLHVGLGPDFSISTMTIGRGGDFPNAFAALCGLYGDFFGEFAAIHAWGKSALVAANLANIAPVIYSPPPETLEAWPGPAWLGGLGNARVIGPSNAVCAALDSHPYKVIRPGIDWARIPVGRDQKLRSQLGFSQDHFVFLTPGQSTRNSADRNAIWTFGILAFMDPRVRLLAWGSGPSIDAAHRMAKRLGLEHIYVDARRRLGSPIEFEPLTGAADAVFSAATWPTASLYLQTCMAAGLPIVAAMSPLIRELFVQGAGVLAVPGGLPRAMAQNLLKLSHNADLRAQLGRKAREIALARFGGENFLDRWRAVYRAVAGGENIVRPRTPLASAKITEGLS